jgi:acetylornithine deacetylase/succinyl-diaminopimelate desuccinylase-like protein
MRQRATARLAARVSRRFSIPHGRFFGLYAGIPAMVHGPNAQDIHAFDERVELDSVRKVTQAIALFIAEWCGVEGV